jgi:hypothetical protein
VCNSNQLGFHIAAFDFPLEAGPDLPVGSELASEEAIHVGTGVVGHGVTEPSGKEPLSRSRSAKNARQEWAMLNQ